MSSPLARLESRLQSVRDGTVLPLPRERERVLNDGYAHVLHIEADLARLSREISDLAVEADHEPIARRLREHVLRKRTLERELERLRGLLAAVD